MKFKLFVRLAERILGVVIPEDEPRADMYLPLWLLALALVLLLGGCGLVVYAILQLSALASVGAVAAIALGLAALLSWKNQTIRMLSEDTFEYTTFLGTKKIYHFAQITALRKNNDSLTLFVGGEKVHIESSAVLSERLVERINRQLDTLYT